jgi:hypothetical protein
MKSASVLLFSIMLTLAVPALGATVREIGAAELRRIAGAGQTISLKRVIDSVAKSTSAEPIEARAFDAGDVFYRIVLKRPDGSLISVIINAVTGEQVRKDSAIGRQVSDAAANGGSKGKSQAAGANANAGGGASGNAGGSAGGNGNGGSGGNGGGNGGGGNGGGGRG